MKKNQEKNYEIYKEILEIYNGFRQELIVDSFNDFFITKRKGYKDYDYELWKFDDFNCKMEKIDLGNTCYLEFKNKFLIVHKIIKDDLRGYYIDEIYELPNLKPIIRSNALGIDIKESNDYYIINELTEDNNGDLYTKRSRLIDKNTKKEVNTPYNIRNSHIIRNACKTSTDDIQIALYDYDNETGVLLSNGVKKGFKNFCEYDNDKILVYDDLDNAIIVDYSGNIINKLKIDIKLKESEKLVIDNFNNGVAKFRINNYSPDWGYSKFGILNSNGKPIISNCEFLYTFDNNKFIFRKGFNYILTDIDKYSNNSNNNMFIGTSISIAKNKYVMAKDNNHSILIDNNGEIMLYLSFHVDKFNIKDNLAIFSSNGTNYLYNLINKEELINTQDDITIINNDTVIINNEIKKIYNLNKNESEKIKETETDKPKVKFLSRFRNRKKM